MRYASIVVYACRSLERLLSCRNVPFAAGPADAAEPAPAVHQRVLTIVAEADDDDYWFAASRDGNREAHYRGAPTLASSDTRPASSWERQTGVWPSSLALHAAVRRLAGSSAVEL